MGCDIHMIAEVKKNGRWIKSDWAPPTGRSYDWFAILANVRNGIGFAGVKTGNGFNVIAEQRGIPDDASTPWKNECRRWDGDFHSHSWLTIEDFDAFDWTAVSVKRGIVSLDQYKLLRGTNDCPDTWSGGIGGQNIVVITPADAEIHIQRPDPKLAGKDVYVHYQWTVKYSEWFLHHIDEVVEPLRALAPAGKARLCFAFDN